MKQKIYYIPGWGETKNFKYSKKIIQALEKNGEVIPIKYISKKGTNPSRNIEMILEQIKKPTKNDILIGFSMGALFAYILNTKIKFKKVIICSIPPVLEKDLDVFSQKRSFFLFSKKEIEEFHKIKYAKPKSPVIFVCGEKENKETIEKTKWLAKKFKSKSIIVKNTDHNLNNKYIKTILDNL
jgi:esterase/lipase